MADDQALVANDGLRADLLTPDVEITPGEPVELTLRVVNTSSVIETVSVHITGVLPESTTMSPSMLKLFPEEAIEVTIQAWFPRALPAGEHEGTIIVSGASQHVAPAEAALHVTVPARPAAGLTAEPPVRTGGRRATFELRVANTGNVPVTAQVRAVDGDRRLRLELDEPIREVVPGAEQVVQLQARGRRPWLGTAVEHLITIELEADGVADTAEVRFRQKPRLTAGVITLLTLALIGLLWALAMLFGVSAALAPSPPTKEVPASFTSGGIGLEDLDPAVAGGAMSGAITAVSTGQPVARVTVEAFDTEQRLVGATATDDDGVFAFDSLLPSRYLLRIRAPGFTDLWWPDAADPSGATLLSVSPTTPLEGIDAELAGVPGSLGGQAIAGDGDQQPITVRVEALDVVDGDATATATTDGEGSWSIAGLPAPATYRVVYDSVGYATVEVTQPLEAGQTALVNTVRLPAADGAISGVVVDRDGTPLGGIEIEAQRSDTVVTATTPTAGEVGTFQLVDLETPGTYLLTFRGEGRASETLAVRLGPGESLEGLEVTLPADTGSIQGRATDADGSPLGGVTVTVSGGDTLFVTETFTSGAVGSFRLDGVPVPGVYAVTFELPGRVSETVQTVLTLESPAGRADARLTSALGRVTGIVLSDSDGEPLEGVVVEVADGTAIRTTTTASAPTSQRGRFVVEGLEPGSYTVTARTPDGRTRTLLRTVTAGATTDVELRVEGVA